MLANTTVVAGEGGSMAFTINPNCDLPELFCQPSDANGGFKKADAAKLVNDGKNLAISNERISFRLNSNSFETKRLEYKGGCFDVRIFDMSGAQLFIQDCVRNEEAFAVNSVQEGKIYLVVINYKGGYESFKMVGS